MTEGDERRRSQGKHATTSSIIGSVLLCLLVFVCLYLVGFGPAVYLHARLEGRGPIASGLETIYIPLGEVCRQWQPSTEFLEWYIDKWANES